MAGIEIGQTFLDLKATNYQGTKGKFFIAMSCAEGFDDEFVCFVMNTEHHFNKYNLLCNKASHRFVIAPLTFTFLTHYTSIMLSIPHLYRCEEMYGNNIETFEVAEQLMCRQIKNCIDFNDIQLRFANYIKSSFKSYP